MSARTSAPPQGYEKALPAGPWTSRVRRLLSPPRPAAGAAAPPADVHTRAAEDRLRFALGTKVRIVRRGEGGSIEIHFGTEAELNRLYKSWRVAPTTAARREIWRNMLRIWTDQVFTIGVVAGVPQPVVVNSRLRNVPVEGVYNWSPGAHFGIYRPDTFWFAESGAGGRTN